MEIPDEYDFPFPPYDIQLKFMKQLYYTLENGKLGIFESPTGTGKTLSIICGALKWLKHQQNFEKSNLAEKFSKLMEEKLKITETSDWISAQSKEKELDLQLAALKKEENKILEYEVKLQNIKKLKDNRLKNKLKAVDKSKDLKKKTDDVDEIEFEDDLLLNDSNINEELNNSSDEEEETSKYEPVKIYICSRTHSQLGQFQGEIEKSSFANNIRVVSLASRQNFCINPNVSNLKSIGLINERCLDMQKNAPKPKKDEDGKVTKKLKSSSCSCPYYKQTAIEELASHVLTEIQDLEDLIQSGKTLNACPYYAARKAAEDAEVILVPYNTILHKQTREANGIKLKNNVVIIDEAHNLLEALAQMYNSELNYCQIFHALQQLKAYKEKFKLRFNSDNLLLINQLIFVVNKLLKMLEECTKEGTSISTIANFVLEAEIDQYNMFKLTKRSNELRLAHKIRSFAQRYPVEEIKPAQKSGLEGIRAFLGTIQSKPNTSKVQKSTTKTQLVDKSLKSTLNQTSIENMQPKTDVPPVSNPLLAVLSFLNCLTYTYEDGRILITKSKVRTDCKFQFLLLKPSNHFTDIINEARSIIVAGGTMSPMSEFRNRLFINAGAEPERIVEFSCDHIIPPENILPIIITRGLNNENLLFNFEKKKTMGNSIKNMLIDTCKIVQGGIVVFFPSYEYENWVWQQLQDVDFGRVVFREPKTSSKVEMILEKYAQCIKRPGSKGALLFSVVGGKLSEGLNFSDDLGRCVIVIGMPYSNITSADLKEKMSFLDRTEGAGAGKIFYENQCMKAVNQCIGRAVRHKNDYATVLLFDQRYARQNTMNALPKWIKKSLKTCNHTDAIDAIRKFFDGKQNL